MKPVVLVLGLLSCAPFVRADSLPPGTYVKRNDPSAGRLTMTIEAVGAARRLTYRVAGADGTATTVSTVLTQLDGKEVPLMTDGKPSGQTMAIREIDSRHTSAVLKFQGKEMGTSKSEISLDGKVLKVDNAMAGPDGKITSFTEYWDRK